jgi:peptide chain release factor 1
MQLLRAKMLEQEQRAQMDAITAERRGMVGSGERSEKIRTYNFPQNRVTDHRIQLTVHNIEGVLQGQLDEILTALQSHEQAEQLRLQSEP